MLYIPLQAIPAQTVVTLLGTQSCQLYVYQKYFGLFLDLYVGDVLIIGGCLCQNLNRLVRSSYLGFAGDLGFWDMQGMNNPYYTGLGQRYQLVYLTPADLVASGVPTLGD